jgi:Beta-galactosidase
MRISRLWSTVPLSLSVSLLSWALLSAHASPIPLPSGLVLVVPSAKPGVQKDRATDLRAINNPYISGVAVQMNWRDIEPVEGQPDWSKLDGVFAAAEKSKKWVQLLIFPGFFAPDWAKQGAQTDEFPIQYGPGKGTLERLPMPWDPIYLSRWFEFLKLLSDRYGKSPAFKMIAADGPTSVSAEMTLPHKHPDHQKWLADSYTPRKYLGAWDRVFQFYAGHFPNQYVSLSGPGLPILAAGRKDPDEHIRARREIVERATAILGGRLAIQNSDLHAGVVAVEAPDQTDFITSYSGRIVTGFQMRGGALHASGDMGAEGDPPLALRRSIDKGMQPNAAGRRVNYLEIYESDVLADEMQPVLRYGASLFSQ